MATMTGIILWTSIVAYKIPAVHIVDISITIIVHTVRRYLGRIHPDFID